MHAEQCRVDSTFGMGQATVGEAVEALEDGMDVPLTEATQDVETAKAVLPYENQAQSRRGTFFPYSYGNHRTKKKIKRTDKMVFILSN